MRILNQPFDEALGPVLISNLVNHIFTEFKFIVAYAKNSGVARLKDSIETFKLHDGKVVAYVGIDQKNTSYEALIALYDLCDELYIVHSENLMSTFHHKVYTFVNDDLAWIAIGSNNLTAGGLWTNYESTMIHEYNLSDENEEREYRKLNDLFTKYSADSYKCSIHVKHLEQIDELRTEGYIVTEAELSEALRSGGGGDGGGGGGAKRKSLFGTETFTAPPLSSTAKDDVIGDDDDVGSNPDIGTPDSKEIESGIPEKFESTDNKTNEIFWFEMRASTGGSRNILDLSMNGNIAGGSTIGTNYGTTNPKITLGGIKFFDINPTAHKVIKNITIRFEGNDYFPSTILFPSSGKDPNGSWRLQLKGISTTTKTPLSEYGRTKFANNILVFEKLSSDKYILLVIDGTQLTSIQSKSVFYSRNGNSKNSRLFGML